MSLERLVDLGIDVGLITIGEVADLGSTKIFVEREGISVEGYKPLRNDMQKYGVNKGLFKRGIKGLTQTGAILGLFYFLDCLVGNENEKFSSHNLYTYTYTSIKVITAGYNLSETYGYHKIANILGIVPKTVAKISLIHKHLSD